MKKLYNLIIVSIAMCCAFGLCACSLPQLDAPLNLRIESSTLELSWETVEDARYYTVKVTGDQSKEYKTSKNKYSLSGLSEGNYVISVQANGKEKEYKNSDWSKSIEFYREFESGMAFKLINGNSEYEITSMGSAKCVDGAIVIPDEYRGKPVTSIGAKAFFNRSELVNVVIGKNVKSIGKQAFSNCSYIESVEIPNGVTTISERAFQSCRKLSGTVVIPDSVTELGNNAFQNCRAVESFEIGSGIKVITQDAFSNCDALTKIVIPDTVEEVQDYAFSNSKVATTLTIGSSVKTIGQYAFAHSPLIASVIVPNSVTIIGTGAFESCSALNSVVIGNGVTVVEKNAFLDSGVWLNSADNDVYADKWFIGGKDKTVKTVQLKDNTVGIADFAVSEFDSLSKITLPDSVKYIGGCAFAGSALSSVVIGSGVKSIGIEAFTECEKLSAVILSGYDVDTSTRLDSSLEEIGNYAFYGCSALNGIVIPNTVKVIGQRAFRKTGMWSKATDGLVYADNWLVDCNTERAPRTVNVKDTAIGISEYAFYDCNGIEKIIIPDSVTKIGRAAFYKCMGLLEVELPSTLERIEDYTFYRCENLAGIILPSTLKHIGRSAFYKCALGLITTDTDNDTLVIPDSVETIGDYAFYGCGYSYEDESVEETIVYGVDKIKIGNGVTTIGDYAFYAMPSLISVEFGNSLVKIGSRAFYKCPLLERVSFGNALNEICDRAFYGCSALKEVSFPDSLKTIGDNAFYKCSSITTIQFGGVENIGNYAFYGCNSLKSLILPNGVKKIGMQAFRNCTSLEGVVLSCVTAQLDKHVFYGCSSMTIYVPVQQKPDSWAEDWNSAYRPVVFGCTLADDGEYIISFVKTEQSIINKNVSNHLASPSREGYVFGGWALDPESTVPDYDTENVIDLDDGTTIYAIWL